MKPGAAKHAGNDAPVAGPAVPAYGLDPADESGDASGGGQGVAVDPGAANDPNGTASGQAGGADNGQANGQGNGQANGQANGQGDGAANGQANGQGNGAANGNAGGNGQSHGAGNGH